MGFVRIILALAVLFQHLGKLGEKSFIDAGMAVYLFFIISGFYMALVLDSKYKGSPIKFYVSRYLRLLPTFLIGTLLAGIYSLALAPGPSAWATLNWPQKLVAAIPNVTIFGADLLLHVSFVNGSIVFSEFGRDPHHNGAALLLNLPTWSIAVEMLFYLAAPFLVRSPRSTIAFLVAGALYYLLFPVLGPSFMQAYRYDLYYPFYFPYFALGILAYYVYANSGGVRQRKWFYPASVVGCALLLALPLWIESSMYLLMTFAITVLFPLTKDNRLDRFLGDLSYPVYVLHLPLMALLRAAPLGVLSPWVRLGCVLCFSAGVVLLVERPFERLRYRMARLDTHPRVSSDRVAA